MPRGQNVITKVAELLNPATGQWDVQLVNDIFCDEDATVILTMPLGEETDDFPAGFPHPIAQRSFFLCVVGTKCSQSKPGRGLMVLCVLERTKQRKILSVIFYGRMRVHQKQNSSCDALPIIVFRGRAISRDKALRLIPYARLLIGWTKMEVTCFYTASKLSCCGVR
jgi:hypothetical protein